jgi:hypothetical protein
VGEPCLGVSKGGEATPWLKWWHKEYLEPDEEAMFLAKKYIEEEVISEKYIVDSQHIAIATVNRCDVLVSWNFQHIVNLRRIRLYNSTNLKYGYPIIEI